MCKNCVDNHKKLDAFIGAAQKAWNSIFPGQDITFIIEAPSLLAVPAVFSSRPAESACVAQSLRQAAVKILDIADAMDDTSPHEVVS